MLRVCRKCGCEFAVDLRMCPQCTSEDAYIKGEEMAKNTVQAGATDAVTGEGFVDGDPDKGVAAGPGAVPEEAPVGDGSPETVVPPEGEPTPEPEDEGSVYEESTVAELKAELAERELPVSGTKAELIARLKEADAAEPEDGASG